MAAASFFARAATHRPSNSPMRRFSASRSAFERVFPWANALVVGRERRQRNTGSALDRDDMDASEDRRSLGETSITPDVTSLPGLRSQGQSVMGLTAEPAGSTR